MGCVVCSADDDTFLGDGMEFDMTLTNEEMDRREESTCRVLCTYTEQGAAHNAICKEQREAHAEIRRLQVEARVLERLMNAMPGVRKWIAEARAEEAKR